MLFTFSSTSPVNNTAVQLVLVLMSAVSIGGMLVAAGTWRRRHRINKKRPGRIRVLTDHLAYVLDNPQLLLELFKGLYYTGFLLSGIYNLFIADTPPLSLHGAMGPVSLQLWYWLNMIGSACCLVGKSVERTTFAYAGLWLQLTGNLTLSGVLLAYVAGTLHVESWGRGGYGAFLGAVVFFSTAIITVRDIRQLIAVEQRL